MFHVKHEPRLRRFLAMVQEESRSQNLISASSVAEAWERHIIDSVQLSPLLAGKVIDVGSGAGLPGIVLAIEGHDMTLVEPRRRRVAFLERVRDELSLADTRILRMSAANIAETFDTITARALAPLDRLLAMTWHLAGTKSRWVLPKGRAVHSELAAAREAWHGRFELVPSITDPSGMIVVAEDVRPRRRR